MTDQRSSTKKLSKYFLQRAIICKFESDRRRYEKQNEFIQRSINKIDQQIENLNEKLVHFHHLNTLIELPLEDYFEQRMERLRLSAEKYMAEFDNELQHEIEHWKNIHSVLSQPWIEPGLLRSDYGALPRAIQRAPTGQIDTIEEENENENNRTTRSLAMINRFSILSNGEYRRKRLNKTFVKTQLKRNDPTINDENDIDFNDSSIIFLD